MRTKKGTAAHELGEAEVLEEAADKKLQAARKMARANAMLDTDPVPHDPDGSLEGAAGFLTDPDVKWNARARIGLRGCGSMSRRGASVHCSSSNCSTPPM